MIVCLSTALFPGRTCAQTGTVAFSQSSFSVNADTGSVAVITVLSTGSSNSIVMVDFTTSGGTATAGVHYVATSNTMTFAVSVFTNTFNVNILGNVGLQSTQTVNLTLLNPTGSVVLGTPSLAVLSIINTNVPQTNAQQLAFSQSAFSVDDTNAVAVIPVIRTGGTNGIVSVDFGTRDGTAKAGIDYTTTTGTVTFAGGDLTNTFAIPILNSGLLKTNQTVNLTLSNVTGNAVLGSPKDAVLTIVATGPPVIQFSAASYNVHEHVGQATLRLIRFGDTTGQATVNYATSDGTAINGIDYLGTSGTLVFTSGVTSTSFSFQFVVFKDFQSNKTVNATLSAPVGASLGTQDTAVVTIVNDRPQTVIVTNGSGDVATLTLQRAGTMDVSGSPVNIVLDSTDAGTTLTVKVKKSKTGTGLLQVGTITSSGDLRMLDAPNLDLIGGGIQLGGQVQQLRLHEVADGASIDVGGNIRTLRVAHFGAGTITASSIGAMSAKGDKRNGIAGDFLGFVALSGRNVAAGKSALGTLKVFGVISNAAIIVDNGNIGSITASAIIDSTIYVGFTPTNSILPLLGGAFVPDLRLRSVSVKSRVNGFANSDLAASIIGKVNLASVVIGNGGVGFGVLVNQSISSVTVKTPPFKWGASGANDQSSGDFHVIHP